MAEESPIFSVKDPSEYSGSEWTEVAVPLKTSALHSPALLEGFLRRVDEQISKKQRRM